MALTIREIQKRDFVGIQVLVGLEGLSELDMLVGPGSGSVTWALSTDAVAPANPQAGATQAIVNTGTNQITLQMDFAQQLAAGWQTIAYLETNAVAGDAAFESPKTLSGAGTKILDWAGLDIAPGVLDLSAQAPAFTHLHPTAAQLLEAGLLDSMLPPLGLSESDSLAKRHFGDDPSSPQSVFGLPDAPVVNANLNWEEINRLLTVGFLVRMNGANADKHQLTEAGKRSAGFAL